MPASYPTLIQQAWCNGTVGGTVGSIAAIPAAPASPHASLNDGFPAITMTPASLGGLPPRGADMNGILNWITSFMVWANGGGQFNFSSTYATSPGYPVGAVIQLAAGNSAYVNITSGNIYDPNGGSPLSNGWLPWAGTLKANVADLANNTNASLGSGMIDYNNALTYTSGTVGYALKAVSNKAHFSGCSSGGYNNAVVLSQKMAGFGSTFQITPLSSGTVLINFVCVASNNSAGGGAEILEGLYNTVASGVPAAGAAATGLNWSAPYNEPTWISVTAGSYSQLYMTAILTGLTPGTAYWFDVSTTSVNSGTASFSLPTMTIVEL